MIDFYYLTYVVSRCLDAREFPSFWQCHEPERHDDDERHYVNYLRLLDVKAEGADWLEVARIVLHCDPAAEELRTYRCWQSHLERAQ